MNIYIIIHFRINIPTTIHIHVPLNISPVINNKPNIPPTMNTNLTVTI